MSLEEFFTTTEVKDGMTTPTLVEELITLMKKEKDYEVKSTVEATKQHSDIARAIAETKNTNCLDHFIKLGGLRYINTWLNDALKSAADTSADIIEESIALQCRALKKLHIDHEKLISSGILDTVKNLCDHNSTSIKDEAKELLDRWKDVDLIVVSNDAEKDDAFGDDDEGGAMLKTDEDGAMLKTDEDGALLEISDVKPKQIENNNSTDAAHGKDPELKGSEGLLLVEVEHIDTEATDSQMIAPASLDQIDAEGGATSVISNTEDDISKAVCCTAIPAEDIIKVDNSNSLELKKDTGEENLGVHENTTNGNVIDTIKSISENLEAINVYQISNTQESGGCSSIADTAMAEQTIPEPKTESNIDYREGASFMKDGLVDNAKTVLCENSSSLDDIGLQKSLVRESPKRNSSRVEGLTASTTTTSDVGPNSRIDEDYSKGSAIQNLARDTKSSAMADTRPDISLDCGTMDALEVARQVAKALEREMVHDGSSENLSDVSEHPRSSDSINEKDSQSGNLSEESSSRLDSSPERSSDREVESSNSENRENKPENCMQYVDQTQASKQEVEVNTGKDICEFDLNQEIPNENVDFSVNFSQNMGEETDVLTTDNPTPVVSASRSPVGTSQFAGSHGCKVSVTASALHHPSPRRDADPDNALSCPPSINAKQKQGAFGIDLNVAEEGDDSNVIPLSEKETTSSANITWGGHYVAAAPAKPERLEFDLNTMSNIEDAPLSSSWRFDKQHFSHLNGHLSYPTASPSSSIQPRVNIDLNEGPPIQSMSSRLHPFFGMSSSQNVDAHKDVKPVISIMGARVEVGRDDSFLGAPPLPNGKYEKHAMETNIAAMGSYLGVGPIGSYGHPSHFGFSNMNAGPNLSFASPLFRPGNTMTYMVDPRVGHVPQMVSQSSVVPPPMYAQPPFLMSMAVPPPGLNGAVSPRPNFDLNLGFMTDGGNRQDMASRQLLRDNQGRFIGEHLNLDSQPSSSFGKRKEPETGWESYPYNMKYHYPPGSR